MTDAPNQPRPAQPPLPRTRAELPEEYPAAMRVGRQTVSLPLSQALSDADVADVRGVLVESRRGRAGKAGKTGTPGTPGRAVA